MEWSWSSGDSAARKEPPLAPPAFGWKVRTQLDTHRGDRYVSLVALGLSYQLANAAPAQDDVHSVIVRFADLDLTHSDGVAALYRRLKGAAETVCARQNGRDLGSQTRYKICWQNALGAAVAKVDRPALTAYYRVKFKSRNAAFQIAQQ